MTIAFRPANCTIFQNLGMPIKIFTKFFDSVLERFPVTTMIKVAVLAAPFQISTLYILID